jgi:chitodextrinase
LTASNSDGSTTAQTTVVVSPDTVAPSVPTKLSATSYSSSQVTLSWVASTDNVAVTGYKILRNGIQVGLATATVYLDGSLAADTTYTYAVAANDGAGNDSEWSPSIAVTTQPQSDSATYATIFPVAENPISEGGRWINGKTAGLDWSDVAAMAGFAIGTQTGSDGFDDSIAVLQGNWGPDQSAIGTVHIAKQHAASEINEVEILLRWALSAHSARGYEINFSTTGQYVQIIRWNGPLGNFTYLDSRTLPNRLTDGDIVKATIVGQVITAYVNDVQVAQASDSTYPGGSPGMGFYLQGTGANSDFGFTSYMATSQASSWAHVQSTARNSGAGSNALAFSSPTAGGNLIVVEVDWSNGSNFVSISDSQGNAFTQVGSEQDHAGVGVKSRLYYAANIGGGVDTVTTVVTGSPAYHEIYLHEYSGLDPISPLDSFSVNVGNGTTFTSGSITTTATHELLYGIEIDSHRATAAADWTTRSTLDSNVAADRDAPGPGTYAYTGQSTGAFIAWIVAFK